jgi:hypothetical protein
MKFEIDIEKLIDYGLSTNQYLLCQFVYQQNYSLMNEYMSIFGAFKASDFEYIINNEYIGLNNKEKGYRFSNFYITTKFINQFIEKPDIDKLKGESVDDWIDIWYNLFPKGIKTMGYLVRSDKNGCIIKLKKFIKTHKHITKEIILKATYDYVQYFRLNNWQGIQVGHYFINKNGVSNLASLCESIIEKIEEGKSVNLDTEQYSSSLGGYSDDDSDNSMEKL